MNGLVAEGLEHQITAPNAEAEELARALLDEILQVISVN